MTCTVDPAWLQAYMATMAALWYCSRSKSTELWRHNSPMRWRKKWGRLVSEVYNSTHICTFYIVYNMTYVGHSYIKDACINKYIYIIILCWVLGTLLWQICIWRLIQILLSAKGHSSRVVFVLRIFRELYDYLSRKPCWATTALMKIQSSPPNHNKLLWITSS